MNYRTAIHDCLRGDSRVSALIGAGDACRHYPAEAVQGVEVPFVVSTEITGAPAETHGLPGDPEDTLDFSLVQFSCFAGSAEDAHALRSAVRSALLEDLSAVLATAGVRCSSPTTRETTEDVPRVWHAILEITFSHNPNS